jgi:glucose-1-phosphate adenylyltransferase
MGIYLFKREVLIDLLNKQPEQADFGKKIILNSAKDYNVQAYLFNDYWEDIGTIESFFNANLALVKQPNPLFSFYNESAPIYTRAPTKYLKCEITESMVSEGCVLKDCRITNSVIGIRSRIESGCTIEDSLIMGADHYQENFEQRSSCMGDRTPKDDPGTVPLGIGANSTIQRTIIDKNARIGCNVQILNKDRVEEADREDQGFCIRSGIVIILREAIIPDGTII